MKQAKIKVGDTIKYKSYGKITTAIVKEIRPKYFRDLLVLPDYNRIGRYGGDCVSIRSKNVLPEESTLFDQKSSKQ